MRARVLLEPAWVLKASAYGDSSLLVEALGAQRGRVGLVARGVRSPKSRTRALLQPFRPLLLSWNESGDLGTLTGAEAAGAPVALDGEGVFSGWYLNELLLRLLPRHDAYPQLHEAYGAALAELPAQGERALRRFELRLLEALGFGLDLPDDLDPEGRYRYRSGEGLCAALPGDAEALSGAVLIALRDDAPLADAALCEVRGLLRGVLAEHLGSRGLATARVLRALREQARGPGSGLA